MKRIIVLSFLIVPLLLVAQSKSVRLFAYQQEVLPGVKSVTIDETGNTREAPNKRVAPNYFIYVEVPAGKEMQPQHVWIKGKLYDVKTESRESPIVMHSTLFPSKVPDTLVHRTSNNIFQLNPMPSSSVFTPSKTAKNKMKNYQLVLHTIEKGKNCYYYLDGIQILEPVALQ